MKVTENGQKIIGYLRDINNANAIAADIASAIDLSTAQVNGSVNSLVKKGLAFREEASIQDGEDVKTVKFIKLTPDGFTVEFDAE